MSRAFEFRLPSGRALFAAVCAIALLIWAVQLAFGQWGSRRCGPVGSRVVSVRQANVQAQALRWGPCAGTDCQIALFRGHRQIGTYCYDRDVYCPYDAAKGTWGEPCEPPLPLPEDVGRQRNTGGGGDFDEPVAQNFGIDLSGMGGTERYSISGRPCTQAEVYEAIQNGQLTDDSRKRRLTVIGSDDDCKRALTELPADMRAKYLVQSYRPDNFAVARCGFKTDGTPSVYFQEPPDETGHGAVLWREDTYAADTWDHVRKADPDYQPNKDPGPGRVPVHPAPGPSPVPAPASVPGSPSLLALLAAGTLALLSLLSRAQPPKTS